MSCFQALGITADASEVDIKRAYARLLKHNRPDVDAGAFQSLHDAYVACLDWVRHSNERAWAHLEVDPDHEPADPAPGPRDWHERASLGVTDAPTGQIPSPTRIDVQPVPAGQSFDAEIFMDELARIARDDTPEQLHLWLCASEPLYSLELKDSLRPMVAQVLAECDEPLPPRAVEVILAFFGLDSVMPQSYLSHWTYLAVERSVAAENFDRVLKQRASKQSKLVDRLMLRELLASDISVLRRLFFLLVPMLPNRLRELALHLQGLDPARARARLSTGSVGFWLAATNRLAITRPRLVLAGFRIPLYASGLSLFVNLLTGPPIELPLFLFMLAWFAGIWSIYALSFVAQAWCQRRFHWDPLTALVAVALVGATVIALPFYPAIAATAFFVLAFWWVRERSYGTFWLAFLTSGSAALLIGATLAPAKLPADWLLAIMGAASLASVVGHDLLVAKMKDLPLHEARTQIGLLGGMLSFHLVALVMAARVLGTAD